MALVNQPRDVSFFPSWGKVLAFHRQRESAFLDAPSSSVAEALSPSSASLALDELLAQVLEQAGLKGDEILRFADLELDHGTREVRRGDRLIELTPTEFCLLDLFLRHPRWVLTRSFIFTNVWGFDFGSMSNSLTVYVGYLRRKIEAFGEPRLIHTVRGVGYVLREPASSS